MVIQLLRKLCWQSLLRYCDNVNSLMHIVCIFIFVIQHKINCLSSCTFDETFRPRSSLTLFTYSYIYRPTYIFDFKSLNTVRIRNREFVSLQVIFPFHERERLSRYSDIFYYRMGSILDEQWEPNALVGTCDSCRGVGVVDLGIIVLGVSLF